MLLIRCTPLFGPRDVVHWLLGLSKDACERSILAAKPKWDSPVERSWQIFAAAFYVLSSRCWRLAYVDVGNLPEGRPLDYNNLSKPSPPPGRLGLPRQRPLHDPLPDGIERPKPPTGGLGPVAANGLPWYGNL